MTNKTIMKRSMVTIMIVLFFTWSVAACHKPRHSNEDDATVMLKEFYILYITETSTMPWDEKKLDSILKKYCTAGLLKQWQELSDKMGYDLLIDGQFCQVEWLKKMVISKVKARNRTYTVTFDIIVNDQKRQKKITLEVTEKNGSALIDKIILDK
jgi:hypothetical protein